MSDIFLSYTERDRDTARQIAEVLGSAGWSVWWDRRIPAGETWRSVLARALENMRCMVVLWSAKSIESEWVYEEASEGRRQGKLVPVLIEDVRPPAGFREIQAADLTDWSGSVDHEGLRLLLGDLEQLLGKPSRREADASDRNTLVQTTDTTVNVNPPSIDAEPDYNPKDLVGRSLRPEPRPPSFWRRWTVGATAGAVLLVAVSQLRDTPAPSPRPVTPSVTTVSPARQETVAKPDETPVTEPQRASPNSQKTTTAIADRPEVKPASMVRPDAPQASSRPGTSTGSTNARCADLTSRIQLGEPLSEKMRTYYRKECQ